MKKLTVPVGVPPAAAPVTTAWSKTDAPIDAVLTVVPLTSTGVVTVVVGNCWTITSSPVSLHVAL
jgi:hypothetical protein